MATIKAWKDDSWFDTDEAPFMGILWGLLWGAALWAPLFLVLFVW